MKGLFYMIMKRVIDHCEFNHMTYTKDIPCSHCRYKGNTCTHVCQILRVEKPLEYSNQLITVEYTEVSKDERFNKQKRQQCNY